MLQALKILKGSVGGAVVDKDQFIVNICGILKKGFKSRLCIILQMIVRLKIDAHERIIRLRDRRSTFFTIRIEI